jgi:hypothetical protein
MGFLFISTLQVQISPWIFWLLNRSDFKLLLPIPTIIMTIVHTSNHLRHNEAFIFFQGRDVVASP